MKICTFVTVISLRFYTKGNTLVNDFFYKAYR